MIPHCSFQFTYNFPQKISHMPAVPSSSNPHNQYYLTSMISSLRQMGHHENTQAGSGEQLQNIRHAQGMPMYREWMWVQTAVGSQGRPRFRTEAKPSFVTQLQENPETEGTRCSDFQFLLLGLHKALGLFFCCCFLCHNTPPVHQLPSYPEAGSRQGRTTAVCKALLITS